MLGGTAKRLAEADGNRTRQTEILGLTGFEDQGAHQDTDASIRNPIAGVSEVKRRADAAGAALV